MVTVGVKGLIGKPVGAIIHQIGEQSWWLAGWM